ncbi:hypothetical protein GN956_G5796 [Arapaima gigas]
MEKWLWGDVSGPGSASQEPSRVPGMKDLLFLLKAKSFHFARVGTARVIQERSLRCFPDDKKPQRPS